MKFLANIQKDGIDVGAGIAGGALGRIITNKVGDKIPYIKDKPKMKPLGAFLIGLIGMGATKGMGREMGRGMAIVAGTDLLGNYVPMVNATDVVNDDLNGVADELADELEARLNDDVNNGRSAVNDDVNNGRSAVNDDTGVNDDEVNDDGVNEDYN